MVGADKDMNGSPSSCAVSAENEDKIRQLKNSREEFSRNLGVHRAKRP